MIKSSPKRGKGRHPKFDEPRRPVTVTLPERTLSQLEAIDKDRARAIVKVADFSFAQRDPGNVDLAIVNVAPGFSFILVGPLHALRRIDLLRMVEVIPGRFLLTVPTGTAIESLEMEIVDALETLSPAEEPERPVLEQLRRLLSAQRKKKTVLKREFLILAT